MGVEVPDRRSPSLSTVELREVVLRKRPDLLPALEDLLTLIDPEIAPPGTSSVSIADPADQPILDAAISAEVDVLVSGDKHFLSLALDRPSIVTASAFLDGYADRQAG
jgi:predicted nucleic acid-binding protein